MALVTLLSAATATGAGTALDCAGADFATFVMSGTYEGVTVKFEASQDGTAWFKYRGRLEATNEQADEASTNTTITFDTRGLAKVRPNLVKITSGSVTVVGFTRPANAVAATGTAAPASAVLIGASDGTNLQTAKCDAQKNLLVGIGHSVNSLEAVLINGNADGFVSTNSGLLTQSNLFAFNGATWDRQRGNVSATLLASAARTASANSADQVNYNGCGVRVSIDVTALTGVPSITVAIKTKDSASGVYTTALASAAITAIGHTELTVYPGLPATANVSANAILSRTWRVEAAHSTADSITYSVSADTLL